MSRENTPQWLAWARQIQALAQTGDMYAQDQFQRQRYARLSEIAAEIVHTHTQLPTDDVQHEFRLQKGYATPKVDVRGAAFNDGRLLLVKEKVDGGWTLPGGWADVGDVPSKAAEREVWEEAGLEVQAARVIGVYDANHIGDLALFHAFKIIFLCEIIGGRARPSNETSEVRFFSRQQIPSNLSGERTKARQIADAFAALQDPSRPTVFD